jgi:hypothetical protein
MEDNQLNRDVVTDNNEQPQVSMQPEMQQKMQQQQSTPMSNKPHKNHKAALFGFLLALVLLIGGAVGLLALNKDSADNTINESTQAVEQVDDIEQETTAATSGLGLFKSSYLLTATEDCEESGNFVDVSKFDGPGGVYATPSLSITCSDDEFTIMSNNMPLWEFVALTPNALEEQNYSWTLPRSPTVAAAPTQIGYDDGSNPVLGDLGFTVSGLVWYGPTEGPQPDPYGDPFTNAIIDECGGHTGPSGEYHEHIIVTKCFFPDWTEDQPAPIVGYALDGFPIYGPTGLLSATDSTVVQFKSSYNETGSLNEYAWDNVEYVAGQGAEYLDQCNGRIQPDGSYGYHLTSSFPYIIGCFTGEVALPTGGGAGGPPQR